MNDCGIYLIENKTTGQKYIGQSTKILERWKKHCSGQYDNKSKIDRAIQKYGIQNFSLKINENGNRKTISSVNINKLKQKVKKSNLLWIKF